MTRRRDMMLLDIIECNHVPMIPIVEDNVILHWICGCGKEVNVPTIYWFKDKGLFTGHPQNIGLSSETEVEHACDAMIKNFEVVKNRFGGNPRITQEAINDLYAMPLASQYELFKSL